LPPRWSGLSGPLPGRYRSPVRQTGGPLTGALRADERQAADSALPLDSGVGASGAVRAFVRLGVVFC